MNALDELAGLIKKLQNRNKAVFVWAQCKSVDWDNGLMDAVSVADDLEYCDVQLGLTGFMIKPAIGSMFLLGTLLG